MEIRPATLADWPRIRAIYLEGIRSGATFETPEDVPEGPAWFARRVNGFTFVLVTGGEVAGWAALSPFSSRRCYRGVAEASVYVAADHHGRGIGDRLLGHLVAAAEARGIWTLLAKVFPTHAPSVGLHEKHGFRHVGVLERVGQQAGQWRDVLLLERRSQVV